MNHEDNNPNEQHDIEKTLSAYSLASAPSGLRERVLSAASKPAKPLASEIALRWAIAALVLTCVWASWQERRTAELMAQTAAKSRGVQSYAKKAPQTEPDGLLARIHQNMLNPRMRMPLPEGYASTRLTLKVSTIINAQTGEIVSWNQTNS